MNIEEAKTEIRRAVSIYLGKEEFGNYRIPPEKQRPVFMIGAPGIGKTAIMEQIARELDLSLVAYSMTHHTRQSAIGLPFILKKNYGGEEYEVSEYTMSEIIASVYENMEKSGRSEGILFLDEINCVSETLAPSMLQFLQYKTFGNHRIPRGWVIVTAGNPPEFNRSVREFDIVTLDRLKVLEIEPDYDTWKHYAGEKGLHRAVRTYLDVKQEDFYRVESGGDGKKYVTARGWEDLSEAIGLYEELGYPVDVRLIGQYIRNGRIAGEFAAYYELFTKYRSDYRIRDILAGTAGDEIENRAKSAGFDERLTVTELLLEAMVPELSACAETEDAMKELHGILADVRDSSAETGASALSMLEEAAENVRAELDREEAGHGVTPARRRRAQFIGEFTEECARRVRLAGGGAGSGGPGEASFGIIKGLYAEKVATLRESAGRAEEHLRNLFCFVENCFGDAGEMLAVVTELTVNENSANFLASHESPEYFRYQKRFMLYERNRELMMKIRKISD